MSKEVSITEVASVLDSLLASTNLTNVTSDGPGFEPLPDGYYLGEVHEGTKLTLTNTGKAMLSMRFTIVENGLKTVIDDTGNATFVESTGTKGQCVFVNYVINDERSLKRMASDMMKFEDPNSPGTPLLPEGAFTDTETLNDAIACLVEGRIYLKTEMVTGKDGSDNCRVNLVKWDAAKDLGLPM